MASQYRLTGRLEGGELAELYRADRESSGTVVVKLFHERTSVKQYARAIADATQRLSTVHHPGIAHVIDIGLVKRRLAIVREDSGKYTLGQVLQRLHTKEVVITSGHAMALIIDLLDAVSEAHGVGVVHGALTPGNVLVSAEGRPSVCDFGALAALNSVAALKKNFAARGRSTYRAPEITKGEALSVQSDVYSLGALIYELLTLREPGSENAQMSTRRDALPPPSRLDRRLNSRIDPIIMRALDPVPGRRYRTTAELASSLREFLTANGGLPSRDELKRFIDQLFPNEVQVDTLGQVPFDDGFTLASVDGADIDTIEDRSMVVVPRQGWSPSLAEFPAVSLEADTGPNDAQQPPAYDGERERSTDWHAPVGAMPAIARSGPKEMLNADVLKRVRHIEDFESKPKPQDDTLPQGFRLDTDEQVPQVFPARKEEPPPEPKARASYAPEPAESQPISAESAIITPDGKRRRMITEERNLALAEAQRKKWIPIVAGSALAAIAFLLLGMWRWSAGDAVSSYDGPRPSERPRPPSPRRPAPSPPKIEKAVKVEKPDKGDDHPRPAPVGDCYAAPKTGQVGYVSVSSTRPVTVLIDGDAACGSLARIPVAAGVRKIVVIDTRTKEEYVQPTRIEAGKQSRLIPIFKGKQ